LLSCRDIGQGKRSLDQIHQKDQGLSQGRAHQRNFERTWDTSRSGIYLFGEGEIGNKFNTRIFGTRIKHQMGAVSIKMYDKFGIILRIETTTNDVSQFRRRREVQHYDGSKENKVAPMKKTIYSLHILAQLLKDSNRRYLEFISLFDDPSDGVKKLIKISDPVKENDRSYKGFNFFSRDDQKLFEILARGEFNINGF